MSDPAQLRSTLRAAGFDAPKLVTIIDVEPRPVLGFKVSGDPIPIWERLRAITDKTGHYPVALADEELLQDAAPDMPTPAKSLAAAAKLNAPKWLKRQALESGGAEEGEWPKHPEAASGFVLPYDMESNKLRKDLKIALLPTREAWQVPAHLRYSSPNYDIEPRHHAAVLRDWGDRFGAEVVCASGEMLECRVARPPTSRKAALALAREQYAYCPDIVEQGVETIANLAAILLKGRFWFFWWD